MNEDNSSGNPGGKSSPSDHNYRENLKSETDTVLDTRIGTEPFQIKRTVRKLRGVDCATYKAYLPHIQDFKIGWADVIHQKDATEIETFIVHKINQRNEVAALMLETIAGEVEARKISLITGQVFISSENSDDELIVLFKAAGFEVTASDSKDSILVYKKISNIG